MTVHLGIDLGRKRIGLALSDEFERYAIPLETLQFHSSAEFLEQLRGIVEDRKIDGLVVGLPLNIDGSIGSKAKEVLGIAEEISKAIPLPLIMWDERYSSVEAESLLANVTKKRKKVKQHVDAIAAQLILQGFLDGKDCTPGYTPIRFN